MKKIEKLIYTGLETIRSLSQETGLDLYVVGGTIRDRLMGKPCSDFDFVTRDAPRLANLFAKKLGCPLVPLDKTPGRETIRVVVSTETYFDFCQIQGKTIEEDLGRRDFTINAMAQPLEDYLRDEPEVIDPCNGKADIKNGIIRVVPGPIFPSDPLRILRAFRFAGSLNFEIEKDTLAKITQFKSGLDQVAAERIRYELMLLLNEEHCAPIVELMDATGVLDCLFPEITPLAHIHFRQNQRNARQTTLLALQDLENLMEFPQELFPKKGMEIEKFLSAPAVGRIKLACLLHLLETEKKDAIHPARSKRKKGNSPSVTVLQRLRASNAEILFVSRTIQCQSELQETALKIAGKKEDISAIYSFVKRCGNELIPVLLLVAASHLARSEKKTLADDPFVKAIQKIYNFFIDRYLPAQASPVLLNGNDLSRRFKLMPSPLYKIILERVEEERILGSISTREEAEALARTLIETQK
ncbi:MAG: CCA tRNA nucleotidyltransferase [Nitrospinales bacterium]